MKILIADDDAITRLSPTRNTQSAKRSLGKALKSMKSWAYPGAINTDKTSPHSAAITELKAEGKCPQHTLHRQVKGGFNRSSQHYRF